MQNKPHYPVEAVDNTLRLLTMLSSAGAVRVTDVAGELGIARSTAHRLLRMLVFRGCAVQREDRAYVAGPALAKAVPRTDQAFLRSWLRPAMEQVNQALDETVHLMVRERDQVLFLDSIEARQPLRVGSRAGVRLPAELTSGGKILLAHEPPAAVRDLYPGRSDVDLDRLERMLARTRRQGFGLNVDESELGISAVAVCVPEPDGPPVAAVSVSAPTMRFPRSRAREVADVLRAAIDEVTSGQPHDSA
jgi:IclR family transcriptional regulator, acetate operon repressor